MNVEDLSNLFLVYIYNKPQQKSEQQNIVGSSMAFYLLGAAHSFFNS